MAEEAPKTEAKPAEKPAEKAPEKAPEKGDGTNYLDFSKYPDEIRSDIEPRFKRIYGHVKQSEREYAKLRTGFETLAKQNRDLEERLSKFAEETTKARQVDVVAELKARIRKAGEDGAYDLQADLIDELTTVKMEAAQKRAPEKEAVVDKVKDAVKDQGASLTRAEAAAIQRWAEEADSRGRPKRPWTQEGHPQQERAASLVNAVMADPDFSGSEMSEILAEVDRLMVKPQRGAATVLANEDGVRPRNEPPIQLSGDEKYVATRLYPDMSPKEAIARYAEQKRKLRKAEAGRNA